ncbi:methyl-accepting chemotaxis protein [Fluviispira sanaruensis]|uniref:Chemotaxis protein n=1 Tax=Fluviispira sanaruensis TaxID=2493639 RepID=A0A4P2VVT3_FLUSA|nr:methyl-accepting chemotaxis protein [Fluviispira sanaruensis]BBH53665.1 chemotaxis protein [Fluviispira sanaruensis]
MEKSHFKFKGLSGQLLILTIIPIVLIVLISVLGWRGIKSQNDDLNYIASQRMQIINIINDMRYGVSNIARLIWIANANQENKEARDKKIEEAQQQINKLYKLSDDYIILSSREASKEKMRKIKDSWKDIEAVTFKNVSSLMQQEKFDDVRKIMLGEFYLKVTPVIANLDELESRAVSLNSEFVEKSLNEAEKTKLFSLFAGIFGTLFTIVFSFTVSKKLLRTLVVLSDQIAQSGKDVSQASTYLSSVSLQVSSGTTEAAAALEQTVASVEELSSMVKLNAENAQQAAKLSQTSYKTAEMGEVETQKLARSMADISESSKKIEEITTVIDNIAFQTNLLALNAAVEAARAGEQGRGFAVVAEAVRNLAQKSASAAKDISNLIKDSVDKIKKGEEIASSTAEVLNSILISIKKVSELNSQISSASHEQANGIVQISKAMNEIDSSTQQNASGSEKVASIASELTQQSLSLQNYVNQLNMMIHGFAMDIKSSGQNKFSEEQVSLS